MTNDEAIKGLKTIRTVHNGNYAEHIDYAIKALEEQRWIPVSERLPEREGWYLTSFDKTYGGADVDMYYKGWVKYGTHVLAWMPLPEPYNIPAQTFGCAED